MLVVIAILDELGARHREPSLIVKVNGEVDDVKEDAHNVSFSVSGVVLFVEVREKTVKVYVHGSCDDHVKSL